MYFSPHENQIPVPEVQQSERGVRSMLKLDHNYEFQK